MSNLAVLNALWSARTFIREAIHDDRRYQCEVFEEVDSLLADMDPVVHAKTIAEETAEGE